VVPVAQAIPQEVLAPQILAVAVAVEVPVGLLDITVEQAAPAS
jgi:hypothetical protein